jgi:1-acyl-sn-glycerol-3-phosphate acyltransferase
MWLLRVASPLSRLVIRLYYRFTEDGPRPPRTGPVLLLANHPNYLLDPVMVTAAAGRPVRFLAKSTLFENPRVAWFVKACGAIPVYRRVDDPAAVGRNVDAFEAVHVALSRGVSVGVFPEGVSHSEPSLTDLKTGSARIALGFFDRFRRTFPIIPVGIVLRDRTVFRSEAVALLGEPVVWDDLAVRGLGDRDAVRELTERIDAGLRDLTVNLERWEDRPVVECVEAIWSANVESDHRPVETTKRVAVTTTILSLLRGMPESGWSGLASRVAAHDRRLRRLGLSPRDLGSPGDLATSLRWTLRRLYLILPPSIAVAVLGYGLFWPPYRLTGFLMRFARRPEVGRSTFKLLAGALVYTLWVLLLAGLAWRAVGPWGALATAALLPILGVAGQRLRERWRGAWDDARRFFLVRSRPDLVRRLAWEQEAIFEEILSLFDAWKRGELGPREIH